MNDNLTTDHQAVIVSAREISETLRYALEAVSNMRHVESWAEREQRLAEGRSSPTGWPVKRIDRADDGLTIPERRALVMVPTEVAKSRLRTFISTGLEASEESGRLIRFEAFAAASAAVLAVGYFFLLAQGGL